MATIRLGTFNCENLFARFKFNSNVDPEKATKNGFDINMLHFELLAETEKELTGKAIAALKADVIALQEVENLDVLKRFRSDHLKKLDYTFAMLVDGNDPRQIDVAVLSRFPLIDALLPAPAGWEFGPLLARLPRSGCPGGRKDAHLVRQSLQVHARQERPCAWPQKHAGEAGQAGRGGQENRQSAVWLEPWVRPVGGPGRSQRFPRT